MLNEKKKSFSKFQLIFVGLLTSFAGYLTAWLLGLAFREEYEDRIAIATESTTCSLGNVFPHFNITPRD